MFDEKFIIFSTNSPFIIQNSVIEMQIATCLNQLNTMCIVPTIGRPISADITEARKPLPKSSSSQTSSPSTHVMFPDFEYKFHHFDT